MIGKCFAVLILCSLVCAVFSGTLPALSASLVDGCAAAVRLSFSLLGMTVFWGGVTEVFEKSGLTERIARVLRPILAPIFPDAFKTGIGRDEVTACVVANLFGLGNAATPLALKAMGTLAHDQNRPDCASDDMVTLTVIGASPFCLFPSTLIALRRAAGSASPFAVLPAVFTVSAICCAVSILLARLTARGQS